MANKLMIASAVAAAVSMGALGAIGTASAADGKEKCYGVAAAGKNDCQTASSSCAGTSKVDRKADAFIVVPEGTCEKIAGGSLEPMKG
jgi:uncharacterized membrane protein